MDWFLYDNGLRHEKVKMPKLPSYRNQSFDLQSNSIDYIITTLALNELISSEFISLFHVFHDLFRWMFSLNTLANI